MEVGNGCLINAQLIHYKYNQFIGVQGMTEIPADEEPFEAQSGGHEDVQPSQSKFPDMKIKRSLINHDLGELLVFTKRERRAPCFVTETENRQKIVKKRKLQDNVQVVTKIKHEVDNVDNPIEKNEMSVSKSFSENQKVSASHNKNNQTQKQENNKFDQLQSSNKEEEAGNQQAQNEQIMLKKQKRLQQQQYSFKQKYSKPKQRRQKVVYKDSDQEQYGKFPFQNVFIDNIKEHHISYFKQCEEIKLKTEGQNTHRSKTFINCDVRFFNWNFFADKVGSFDVVLIDPPWRIKGAQQNDSQFMFSNCKFSLEYNTMSNNDIANIDVGNLSKCGFIFLWILNTQLGSSLEIMNKWGYELVDTLIWVKLKNEKVFLTNGFYFMHSYQMCLIGYKSHPDLSVRTSLPISNNLLFAEVRKKSQKPDQLYQMIEMMFPNNKKVQIFARNNNLRFGWFSLGNQLGQSYDKWLLTINCDRCQTSISPKIKRFKSKFKANYDLCQNCVTSQQKQTFYQIQNQVTENIIHLYRSCNKCQSEPIWGNRFQCKVCPNFDLCEACFDHNLQIEEPFHDIHHDMEIVEVPLFGHGFAIHDVKCSECFQKPIIGICFACNICKSFNLCQKCFFQSPDTKFKRHSNDHSMQAIFDPSLRPIYKKFQCFGCTKQILENCYMCENCHNFFFCQECHQNREQFKTNMANNHKDFHKFIKVF